MDNPGQGHSICPDLSARFEVFSQPKKNPNPDFIRPLVVYLACLWNLLGMAILPGSFCPI
jgi:hypothetical protein